jgi:hypothetical protein
MDNLEVKVEFTTYDDIYLSFSILELEDSVSLFFYISQSNHISIMQLKQLPFLAAIAFLSTLQLVSAGSFLQAIAARDASPLGGDTLASRPLSMTPLTHLLCPTQ